MGKSKVRKYKVHDLVQCRQFGSGIFKVVDIRDTSEPEVRLLDPQSGKADWFYETHCSCDSKTRRLNQTKPRLEHVLTAKKILDKPKLKR